jgi:aryl-alcohol dehydrogenase-like predicted oxidoreductase
VSKIILGTASYGSPRWQEWILNEEAALPLLKHAYDMGINTWDTVASSALAFLDEFLTLIAFSIAG